MRRFPGQTMVAMIYYAVTGAMIRAILIQAAALTVHAILWYAVSRVRKRNDVADIAWPIGYILAVATALAAQGGTTARSLLLFALILLWGARLAVHISTRNRGTGEDPRYRTWREEWGRHEPWRAFLQIFLLQQYLVIAVAAPATYVIAHPGGPSGMADAAGVGLWSFGFLFESVADYQLFRFKSDPANKGRIMQGGLWRYSRHPNYFGEVALWWGVYLIALAVPGGWMMVFGPLTITVLILVVSGIPMLEARYEGNAEFAEYKRRTSAFFPMPRKA